MAKQQTQVQQTLPTPYVQDLLTSDGGLFSQMESAMQTPFQQYNQPRFAGFTQDQLQAFDTAREGIGVTEQEQQQARDLLSQSQQQFEQGGQQAQQLLDQASQGTGLIGDAAQMARQQAQQGSQTFDQARSLTEQAAQGVTPGRIQQFQDPFQQQVIDTTMDELRRQNQIEGQSLDAQAAQAGAFGGSRHGVMEAERSRNLADIQARTLADLQSQGYGQALQAAQQDVQNEMRGAGQLGQLGQSQAGLQQQAAGQLMRGGQGLTEAFSGLAGQQAGIAGQQASGFSDLARQQLGLGSFEREQQMADANDLMRIGQAQQEQEQQALDFQFEEFLRQRQYEDPMRRTGFMADIIGGAPTGQVTQTTQSVPEASQLEKALGLGATGVGLYNQWQAGQSNTGGTDIVTNSSGQAPTTNTLFS